jgi:5'-nucleotidase
MLSRSSLYSMSAPSRALPAWWARAVLAGALALASAACGDDAVDQPDAANQPDSGPDSTVPYQVHVQLLAFNDFHGNLEPPSGSSGRIRIGTDAEGNPEFVDAGGAMYFARHIAELRATQPNTVVVSAGDMIGASPLISGLFHDEPTIEAMNLMGVDINGVGNHEFDEGTSELLRMQYGGCHPMDGCQDGTPFAGADFKFLAANVATGPDTTIFPAYDIREFEGVKIAFIGMTLKGTPEIVTPVGVAGLEFRDEIETVNELVPKLQAQGVHAIVVVLHEGGLQAGLYDECDGISGPIVDIVNGVDDEVDVFITGHTHQAYNCVIDNKLVTSAASFGRLITDIDLVLDSATGDVVDFSARNVIVTREVGDIETQNLVSRYNDLVAPLRDRVLGFVTEALSRPNLLDIPSGESTLGNVIADSQLAATQPENLGNARIAFMNPGGIRTDLDAGDVTFGEIFTIQPFGNSLVTMTLTGAQIELLLEQQWINQASPRILQVSQGFSYTWQASAPVGERVDPGTIMLDGEVIDPAASYRVTVNSFLASGGDGFSVLNEGTNRLGGDVDVDALEKYLAANNPLAPPALGRITRAE